MLTYVDAMLAASDEFMCHRKGHSLRPGLPQLFDFIWKARAERVAGSVEQARSWCGTYHRALNGGTSP